MTAKPNRLDRRHPARATGRRRLFIAVGIVLAVGILAGGLLLRGGEQGGAGTEPGFASLKGRWVRLDGGYVLEIRNVDAGGAIDAVYLNPRPIHVAGAQATREGSALKVVVELNAPGYPGSTYTLTRDPKADQLRGVYFQAAMRQAFDVVFVRAK